MPTNLPPEYHEAERRYKEAKSPDEKAVALEELLSTIPKHKGTDKLRADYRKKLSKFKSQAQAKKKTGQHETSFHIVREGDVRIIILGCANVGKSSLVSSLTHASPEVSVSPYSTWVPTPGMLEFEGVHLQLIDTPSIDREYIEPEFLELIKNSDLLLLIVDLQSYPIQQFQNTIEILEKNGVLPLHKNTEMIESKTNYLPMIVAVNKDDGIKLDEEFDVLNELLREDGWILLPISVKTNRNINELFQFIIKEMKLIRVYSKRPHQNADMSHPFVLKKGSTVDEFAAKVHHDFIEKLKNARIWGTNVHDGQMVGKEHILHDSDVVELHI